MPMAANSTGNAIALSDLSYNSSVTSPGGKSDDVVEANPSSAASRTLGESESVGHSSNGPITSRLRVTTARQMDSQSSLDSKTKPPAATDHECRDRLGEADEISIGSNWTESTLVPQRNLGFIQVTAFMINQTVGVGIFSTPAYVLFLTGSKPLSLGLWAVGGVYTILK